MFKTTVADYNIKRDKSMGLLFPECYFHKHTENYPPADDEESIKWPYRSAPTTGDQFKHMNISDGNFYCCVVKVNYYFVVNSDFQIFNKCDLPITISANSDSDICRS